MTKPFVVKHRALGLAVVLMAGVLVAPEARAQDASAVEGEWVKFSIARPATTTGATFSRGIRYTYATADGTAESGDDYGQRLGYVIWSASAQSASVSVPTYEDDVDEGSGETFKLQLSDPRVTGLYRAANSWISAGSLFPQSITLTATIEEPE